MKIGVLGAGVEGLETVRYLVRHGFSDVTLFDQNPDLKAELPAGVKAFFGFDYLEKAAACDVIFRSPGIDLKKLGALAPTLTSATRYFFEHCPCPIIGVTGTKGKGTTSTLIYLMLKEGGKDVYLGGNIGESPLKFLDDLKEDSLVVLELSSFQLQDLDRSPQIAVLLGVTSDHLDYHNDVDEYWEAKSSLVKYQKAEDLAILNHDYESAEYYEKLTPAKKILVSTKESGGDGVHLSGPMIVNCAGVKCELILNSSKVAIIGKHHFENILPAVAVARHFEIGIPQIQKVLTTFKGLPHRLEEVAIVGDVRYFDDSISTTPETSIAAVRAFDKPVILIAGGSDKGADYTEWGIALQQATNLKCVVLCGRDGGGESADDDSNMRAGLSMGAEVGTRAGGDVQKYVGASVISRMEKALQNAAKTLDSRGLGVGGDTKNSGMGRHYPLEILKCATFEEAIKAAHDKAAPGDVVVLSPAAASFDMFKNYQERGEKFKAIVQKFLSH